MITAKQQYERPGPTNYGFLFSSLWNVLNFLINSDSLSFLYCGSYDLTFSKIETFMSLLECPGRLKWWPAGSFIFLVFIYPKCSQIRSLRVLSVSPMYLFMKFVFVYNYFFHKSTYILCFVSGKIHLLQYKSATI